MEQIAYIRNKLNDTEDQEKLIHLIENNKISDEALDEIVELIASKEREIDELEDDIDMLEDLSEDDEDWMDD